MRCKNEWAFIHVDRSRRWSARPGKELAAMAAKLETGTVQATVGGGFLLEPVGKGRFLSPEGFTEEQRLFFKTADEFVRREVLPNAERIEHKEYDVTTGLIRQAGELGLLAASIPQ